MTPVAVFAVANRYSWDVVDTVRRAGLDVICIDNIGRADPELPNLRSSLDGHDGRVVLGPGLPGSRARAAHSAVGAGADSWDPLIDRTAVLASTARTGHGAYVNVLVSVGSHAAIGCFCNINRSSSIGHDCVLGAFTATGPNATLCGEVSTGFGVFVGAGSVVLPGVSIGSRSVVGAGSVVTRDIPEGVVVAGNPARIIKEVGEWTAPTTCPSC